MMALLFFNAEAQCRKKIFGVIWNYPWNCVLALCFAVFVNLTMREQ